MSLLETPSKFRERSSSGQGLRSQSGQGMVEYILIVTVSVIIVISLAVKLYKPLGDFIEAMMGTYTACLLETGDLPSLGSSDTTGDCKPPDFAAMAGDSKVSSTGNQDKKDSSDANSDKVKAPTRSNRQSASDSSGSRNRQPLIVGQGPKGSAEGDSSSGKKTDLGAAATETNGYFGSGGSGSIYRRQTKYLAVSGEMAEQVKKRQEREDAKTSTAPVEGDSTTLAKKKIPVVPPPPKDLKDSDATASFDISQIIKYLLIAGIIIVLIVLIGGQAMQLSKSWEKGGE